MSAEFFRHLFRRNPNGKYAIPRVCPFCVPDPPIPYFAVLCHDHAGVA